MAELVFVGGAPRSGTTLVQRLMGAHSKVYAGPEFDFVPKIVSLRGAMANSIDVGRISPIVDLATLDGAFANFIHEIFDKRAGLSGADVFCEKTPSNALVFSELADLFPSARFVLVLRDPRAIASSMKQVALSYRKVGKTPPGFCRSVVSRAREIDRHWRAGFEAMLKYPGRVMAVHYERLLLEPELVAQELCEFTGLEYEEGMIRIEESKFDFVSHGVEHWYSSEQLTQAIDQTKLEDEAGAGPEVDVLADLIPDHSLVEVYGLRGRRGRVSSKLIRALESGQALGKRAARAGLRRLAR